MLDHSASQAGLQDVILVAVPADGQPLLPAACALALMPRPALQHAPTALQHLMGHGSPISDVFDECEECARLRTSEAATQAVRLAFALADLLRRLAIAWIGVKY